MIRKSKEGFVEGNNFIQIKKFLTKEDEETVLNKVFGYTINEGKYYLIDNLKFNILKPFIRISTVFYMPSIQLKDAISISKKELYRKYTQEYDMNTKFTQFEGMLDQLNRAEILKEKKGELLVVSNILKNIHRNMSIDKNLSVIYSY